MSPSSLFFISITLLVLILTVESVYNVYSYDDGNGGEEHCCVARIRENLCLATPLTRTLVQVDKKCHRLDMLKRRRSGGKLKKTDYLDKISRRLDIQSSQEIGDKILLQLKRPLETNMVQNDLVCLTSTNNTINFEKCYAELADEFDEDSDDDDNDDDENKSRPHKRHPHRQHRIYANREKRVAAVRSEKEGAVLDGHTDIDENKAKKEMHRIELHRPVHIHEGYGLFIRQAYALNLTHIRRADRQQNQCLSWYRKRTRKIRHNPSKHPKSCFKLDIHHETCLNELIFNNIEPNKSRQHTIISLPVGSKLYCKDQAGYNKLLGSHRQGQICFHKNDLITIEQKFTDVIGLSAMDKNKDLLEFIAKDKKLTAEFEHDCHDKQTLVELKTQDKEYRGRINRIIPNDHRKTY